MDNDKASKIREIIQNNDLDIDICTDGFYIISGWTDLNKLVAAYNDIPISCVEYGRFDKDKPLTQAESFMIQSRDITGFEDIDSILPEWGFSDENLTCDDCYNHITTTPGYYGDIPQYVIMDGSVYCGDCIRGSHTQEYLETLINNPEQANIILTESDMENLGFIKCNCKDKDCEFWNGLYEGANDDPKEILKTAIAKNPDKNYVFDIIAVGQFDINFTIWNRDKPNDE